MSVMEIISEGLEIHSRGNRSHHREAVASMLREVGLDPDTMDRYPHEFSGGQRQRVVVAGALVLEPELLVADEPVSMLDVSIRADILTLLQALRKTWDITILYTTHDLATAGYFTDRMAVMYLGRVVELGKTVDILKTPRHPYTQALVSVAPVPNPRKKRKRIILQGEVPNPINLPSGCRFHPRCPKAMPVCSQKQPKMVDVGDGHRVQCWLFQEDESQVKFTDEVTS